MQYCEDVVFLRVGGTVGAVITCPLEVVKTRLQSSSAPYQLHVHSALHDANVSVSSAATCDIHTRPRRSFGLIHCLRYVAVIQCNKIVVMYSVAVVLIEIQFSIFGRRWVHSFNSLLLFLRSCLQCFDAVGWAAARASGL